MYILYKHLSVSLYFNYENCERSISSSASSSSSSIWEEQLGTIAALVSFNKGKRAKKFDKNLVL